MSIQQRRPQRPNEQPFDQRLLMFLLVGMSTLMLYQSFVAPPPVAQNDAEQQAADAPADAAPPADEPPSVEAPAPPVNGVVEAAEAEPAAEPERVALGSVESGGAYRMLMTINNVGGGLERVELASEDYRDLDDRSGYLGQLALTDAPDGGALVNVVGAGTPASAAGVEPGDIITAAAAEAGAASIDSASDLTDFLESQKSRGQVTLSVTRNGEAQDLTAELRRQPLDLIRPEVENVRLHTPTPPEGFESVPSFLVRIATLAGRDRDDPAIAAANKKLAEEAWSIDERSPDGVALRMRLPELQLEFVKKFTVFQTPEAERENEEHPSYHFDFDVEVRNLAAEPQAVAYDLAGPNGLPIEGFWYANKIGRGDGSFFGDWGTFGLRDVVVRFANDRITQYAPVSIAKDKVPAMGQGQPLAYVGVDSQYFSSILIPKKESLTDVWLSEVRAVLPTEKLGDERNNKDRWQNSSVELTRQAVTLAAAGENGSVLSDGYRVFAGPKLPELLDAYVAAGDANHSLEGVLYYGWFGWAAKPMLWLLHAFNSVVGNYGIAIILLTVCVRGAMFPISRRTAMNMVKMQELKPELDRIAERYKEDMQKRAQAQQELFRKHNFNPAGGCLPMFLQLPIFMGLYRALAVDVELRQAPLVSDTIRFCGNLAAPDQLIDWSGMWWQSFNNGQGMLYLGPYFNILPLAACGLILLQQKMFMPPPANEQAELQQKMMQYMMLFMGFMFFKVPSGLCLYFIASSLWGIAERKMLPRVTPPATPTAAVEAPATKASSAPSSNGAAKAKRAAKKAKAKGKKRR